MGQTKKTGKRSGGAKKATGRGGKQGGGGAQKKATKAPAITKGLKAQASSSKGGPVIEDPRALAAEAVAEVEVEGVEAEGVEAEGVEAEGVEAEGAESEAVEAPTPVVEAPTPVVEAPTPVVEDPITRAKAAATAKNMPARKVALITSTAIAEFILAQIDSDDLLRLTPTQIKNMTTELSPEQQKAKAKEEAEKAAQAAKAEKDKARAAAEITLGERQAELAALIETEAAAADAQCTAYGLAFSSTMRSHLDTTIVIDANALKSMAPKTFVARKAKALADWHEKLRVEMITARYHQLRVTSAPPKGGPHPKGENLASLSKLLLKELFDAAVATPGMSVAAFDASGDAALLAQRKPTADKWVEHIGLKYNPEWLSVGSFSGMGLHATAFRGSSIGPTLPEIRKHTSTEIMKKLFEDGVPEMSRIHVSLEAGVMDGGHKNPHRYWRKADPVLNYNNAHGKFARYDTSRFSEDAIDGALKGAMAKLETHIEARVVEAMEKDGAI